MITNPHDTDAEYRTKSGKTIRGDSVNVCETCDAESLHLIVDVQTAGAGESDKNYLKRAVKRSQEKVTLRFGGTVRNRNGTA